MKPDSRPTLLVCMRTQLAWFFTVGKLPMYCNVSTMEWAIFLWFAHMGKYMPVCLKAASCTMTHGRSLLERGDCTEQGLTRYTRDQSHSIMNWTDTHLSPRPAPATVRFYIQRDLNSRGSETLQTHSYSKNQILILAECLAARHAPKYIWHKHKTHPPHDAGAHWVLQLQSGRKWCLNRDLIVGV